MIDGEYSSSGWKDYVEIEVTDGEIDSVYWSAKDEAGNDRKMYDMAGKYGMVVFGGAQSAWYEQAAKVEQHLINTQDVNAISFKDDGIHTDDIAGVSIRVNSFASLASEALEAGPIEEKGEVKVVPPPVVVTAPHMISSVPVVEEEIQDASDPNFIEVLFKQQSIEKPRILLFSSNLGSETKLRQEIIDFNSAVEENRLAGAIDWSISQNPQQGRFEVNLEGLHIINNINGEKYSILFSTPLITNSYLVISRESKLDELKIEESSVILDVIPSKELILEPGQRYYIDFQFIPTNNIENEYILEIGDEDVAYIRDNEIIANNSQSSTTLWIRTNNGLFNKKINLQVEYTVGSIGPAGGLVIYDAGDYSKGWRYIEASSEDAHNWLNDDSLTWGDVAKYENISVTTEENIALVTITQSK